MNVFFNFLKKIVPYHLKTEIKKRLREWLWAGKKNTTTPSPALQEKHIASLQPLLNRSVLLNKLPSNGIIAEIGVAEGKFSEQIFRISNPQELHLIDAWDSTRYHTGMLENIKQKFSQQMLSGKVKIHRGYSTAVADSFPDKYFDWIYLDTDHSYLTTREELALYAPKMKTTGVIAGHDFTKGNFDSGIRYGVIEAVYEFCEIYDWELIYVTMDMDASPSFAIRRIKGKA